MRPALAVLINFFELSGECAPQLCGVERDKVNQQQDDSRDGQEKQRQELQLQQAAASANVKALEQQHQAQAQALAQRHTMEQKALQDNQARKPEGRDEAPPRG